MTQSSMRKGGIGVSRVVAASSKIMFLICLKGMLVSTTASANPVAPEACGPAQPSSDLIKMRGKLATKLRLAVFRADLADMDAAYETLEGFKATACDKSQPAWLTCDSVCYREIASYFYFKASELPVMSESGAIAQTPSPAAVLAFANKGIEAVDSGRAMLQAEQKITLAKDDASDEEKEASNNQFNDYLRHALALAVLEARLHTLVGDSYYQALSAETDVSIDALVRNHVATSEPSVVSDKCTTRLCDARFRYKKAMWVLIEAKASLPAVGFENEAGNLRIVEDNLQMRLASIESGKLFIGVDPFGYTPFPTKDLVVILQGLLLRISNIESTISRSVQEWQAIKNTTAEKQREEQRYFSNQDVNLKMYQIAQIEQQAKIYGDEVRSKIEKLNLAKDTFQNRREARQTAFALKVKTEENKYNQTQIVQRQAQDILAMDMEQANERRSELRWLISYESSINSLTSQIASIDSQALEYSQRKTTANARIATMKNQISQKLGQQKIIANESANLASDKATLERQKGELYALKRAMVVADICQAERDYAYLTGKLIPAVDAFAPRAEFFDAACGLPSEQEMPASLQSMREDVCRLKETSARYEDKQSLFVRKCVLGADKAPVLLSFSDGTYPSSAESVAALAEKNKVLAEEFDDLTCSSDGGLSQVIKKMKENSEDNIKHRREQMEHTRSAAVKALEAARAEAKRRNSSLAKSVKAITAAASIAQIMANFPDVYAGTNSGTGKSDRQTAAVTLTAIQAAANAEESAEQANYDMVAAKLQLDQKVTELIDAVKAIDLDEAAREVEIQQVSVQLMDREHSTYFALNQAFLQNRIQAIECDSNNRDLGNQIEKIRTKHKMLMLQLETSFAERAIIDADIAKIDNDILSKETLDEELKLDIDNLNIEIGATNQDIGTVTKLEEQIKRQLVAVNSSLDKIRGWHEDAAGITEQIADLFAKKYAKMNDIAASGIDYLKAVLNNEQTQAEASLAELKQIQASTDKVKALLEDAQKQQASTTKTVQELRDYVHKASFNQSSADSAAPGVLNRFLVSEDVLASLTKGMPDFLAQKKNYLATVNYVLGHLRTRARILDALTERSPDDVPVYVSNSGDLAKVTAKFCRPAENRENCEYDSSSVYFDTDNQVQVDVSEVVVPRSSALIHALNAGEMVSFDVSPAVRSKQDLIRSNYLTLGVRIGDESANLRDMYLMDVKIAGTMTCNAQGGPATTTTGDAPVRISSYVHLEHTGIGYVVDASNTTKFVISSPRESTNLVRDLTSGDTTAALNTAARRWQNDSFTVATLPETDIAAEGPQAPMLPFLGAPVFGRYNIQMRTGGCDIQDLKIIFYHTLHVD